MRMISFTQTSTKQVEISLEIQMSKSTEKNAELLGLIKIFFSLLWKEFILTGDISRIFEM
jgi:hypothetical protein